MTWEYKYMENHKLLENLTNRLFETLTTNDENSTIKILCDTRPLHRALFYNLTPLGSEDYSGCYRGQPDTNLTDKRIIISYNERLNIPHDKCTRPEMVIDMMASLGVKVNDLINSNNSLKVYIDNCFCIFAEFLIIHPYINGNGHIARILLKSLLYLRGVDMCKEWTLHKRPYCSEIALALQQYSSKPQYIKHYLLNWVKNV